MMYCIQYSTLAPLLIKVKQKGKSDGNLLTSLLTAVGVYLWHAFSIREKWFISIMSRTQAFSLQIQANCLLLLSLFTCTLSLAANQPTCSPPD